MNQMNSVISVPSPYNFGEEGNEEVGETEYAGITASWLRKAIQELSQVALLNSKKKTNAVVTIQSYFRGWKARKQYKCCRQSAIKIQKVWRGFTGRIRYFDILQSELNSNALQHYNKSATLIQKIFRGYYSRKFSHDHLALKTLQIRTASEVLRCVALKTRCLLKNHQLPGVYSLRNTRCLSRVEKLKATLKVRFYNEDARKIRKSEVQTLNKAVEKSIQSKEITKLPFGYGCTKDQRRSLLAKSIAIEQKDDPPVYYDLVRTSKESRKISAEKAVSPPPPRISTFSDLSFDLYSQRRSRCFSQIK